MLQESVFLRLSKMYTESKSSDILNPYYVPDLFFLPGSTSFEDSLMVKVIVWKLSGNAGINIIENMVDNRS